MATLGARRVGEMPCRESQPSPNHYATLDPTLQIKSTNFTLSSAVIKIMIYSLQIYFLDVEKKDPR
jgi:hypothetical protein